jgi:hypothetical protein
VAGARDGEDEPLGRHVQAAGREIDGFLGVLALEFH